MINNGERVLVIPARCTVTPPDNGPPTTGVAVSTARVNAGPRAAGAAARPTQPTASTPSITTITRGDSLAPAAASLRGRAKNPTPTAFTNVATENPAVRATTATAAGITSAVVTPPDGTA